MTGRFWSRVQTPALDPAALEQALAAASPEAGAAVTFIGRVRGLDGGREVAGLELEHYPGMTEASLAALIDRVRERWTLAAAAVVHRVGFVAAGECIVWVGVSAAHRADAFAACECLMDYLKTEAPFWKKEHGPGAARWVEARKTDEQRASRWRR